MYAVQEGIKLGKGDPDAKAYLMSLMDNIQTVRLYNIYKYYFSYSIITNICLILR